MLWQLLHLCFVGPSLLLLRYHLNSSVFLSACLKVTLSAAANLPPWLRLLRQLMTSGHCSCLQGCVLMLIRRQRVVHRTQEPQTHSSKCFLWFVFRYFYSVRLFFSPHQVIIIVLSYLFYLSHNSMTMLDRRLSKNNVIASFVIQETCFLLKRNGHVAESKTWTETWCPRGVRLDLGQVSMGASQRYQFLLYELPGYSRHIRPDVVVHREKTQGMTVHPRISTNSSQGATA